MTTKHRRLLAIVLIIIGALLLWLAPESPGGIIALILGVAVEFIGIALEKIKAK